MTTTGCGSGVRVEVLYLEGCPSHQAFLPHLRWLLHDAGVTAPLQLVRIESSEHAVRERFLGSPTLRIEGVDVDPTATGRTDYGLACRLYRHPDGTAHPFPADDWITRAVGACDGGQTARDPARPAGVERGSSPDRRT